MTQFNQGNPETERENLKGFTQEFKHAAAEQSASLKQEATQTLDENRSKAADQIEDAAEAARTAASELEQQDHPELSHYVSQLADNVTALANGLREKSIDDLIRGAEKIARENPALFIAGSVAIGLGIARFAKASSHRSTTEESFDDVSDQRIHSTLPNDEYTEEDWLGRNSIEGDINSSNINKSNLHTQQSQDFFAPFDDSSSRENLTEDPLIGARNANRSGFSKSDGNGAYTTGDDRYE